MSACDSISRLSIADIQGRKGGAPLVCLTAYTASMARLLDPHADLILVGDSLGMVVYGLDNTLGVTLDMMAAHGSAVVRATRRACVVIDMPFGSYQESPQAAFRAAARLMGTTGCCAVKIEGGIEMAETVAFLTARHIPVVGHVGLMPQGVQQAGGYRAQGRTPQDSHRIVNDAQAIAQAGACALVAEGVWEACARQIVDAVPVPVIGIGASVACDGQILVSEDMLGLHPHFSPKFVKTYADLATHVDAAAARYAQDVRARQFPGAEHCFGTKVTPTPLNVPGGGS